MFSLCATLADFLCLTRHVQVEEGVLLLILWSSGFAESRELRVEELGGEGASKSFDSFALLRGEAGEFGLRAG